MFRENDNYNILIKQQMKIYQKIAVFVVDPK